MPTIATASELRGVLGVNSTILTDTVANDIIDTAENMILPMLVTFQSPVDQVELTDNIATYRTTGIHEFTEGQSVVITGCGSPFNGTFTILADNLTDYTFSASITNADIIKKNIIPSGLAKLSGASTYVGNPNVHRAVLLMSVDVYGAAISPNGTMEGLDGVPSPYKMGRMAMSRISALVGPYIDVETIAQ